MLVLQRFAGEIIEIGDNIIIQVIEVRSDVRKVRLGITAPKEIAVHRKEIADQIRAGISNKPQDSQDSNP